MLSLRTADILIGLLAARAVAQAPVSLCTGEACDNCPNALTTAGTGYPQCVIYDRDTVLGAKESEYEPELNGGRMIYYDIAEQTDQQCRTIIRTPASTDEVNCGIPIYAGKGGVCFPADTRSTFMVQFCCGTGDCSAAGASRIGGRGTSSMSSMVLRDAAGDLVIPHSVGSASVDHYDAFLEDHGLNASTVIKSRSVSGTPVYKIGYAPEAPAEKRACDTFVQGDRGTYSKTGSESFKISNDICGETTTVAITNEKSVGRSTTFGLSVGDPWGVVSASVDFTIEESASQSQTYTFAPVSSQCGHVAWTPYFICVEGTIAGCEGGDQTGEVCTAKRINETMVDGIYRFVQTG